MGKLIYSYITSLDGYVADKNGHFEWGVPDEAVHSFINKLYRNIHIHLYSRLMYEIMIFWENIDSYPDPLKYILDFAEIWQKAEKIVFFTTLKHISSANTQINPNFDIETIQTIKRETLSDILIGGATLASQALKTGLIDEIHLFLTPILIGSGKPVFPSNILINLEILDESHFPNGMVYLRYRIK